jgi:hypothetical protein
MSILAQELNDKVMDLVRDGLRGFCDNEILLSCMTIAVIRNINEAGYKIGVSHV